MRTMSLKILDKEETKLEAKNADESLNNFKISNIPKVNMTISQNQPTQVQKSNDIFQLTRQEIPNQKRMTLKLNTTKSQPNRRTSQLKTMMPLAGLTKSTSINQLAFKNTIKAVDQIDDQVGDFTKSPRGNDLQSTNFPESEGPLEKIPESEGSNPDIKTIPFLLSKPKFRFIPTKEELKEMFDEILGKYKEIDSA